MHKNQAADLLILLRVQWRSYTRGLYTSPPKLPSIDPVSLHR
jgi:hypothetical protein